MILIKNNNIKCLTLEINLLRNFKNFLIKKNKSNIFMKKNFKQIKIKKIIKIFNN